ncbi:MAG: class I SAM-dependent methyltransferase, partial [Albidovulum sp.]
MRTIRRKLREEVGIVTEAGFPVMGMTHYLTYLENLHLEMKPQSYFEIGTESGASLSFATCISVGVDPQFRLQDDVSRNKPELHLFQGTSDDFFASRMLERLGLTIDLAFLDGMHLFEFLLRDFINVERHMSPGGTVLMHDCVPFNRLMAERDWDATKTRSWAGDVWKLIPILREYRPDLNVRVLDLAPTGLVVVSGFDPDNRVLAERYDEIVDRFKGQSLDDFGLARFVEVASITSPAPKAPRPKRATGNSGIIAIKTCVPSAEVADNWGDFHFANSLAAAFRRLGREARVDIMPNWYSATRSDALDIVLQGHDQYQRNEDVPSLLWFIYPGKRFDYSSLRLHDHVFVASDVFARKLARRIPGLTPTVLHQCFDPEVMRPSKVAKRSDLVFVANNHFGKDRPIAKMARDGGHPMKLWGRGWDDQGWQAYLQGLQISNSALGSVY